ncbi:MAG: DUF6263 family protein [Planctomycetaceae bacterium]|jgi:hypothetical protein|nr:DUF6263 family protein [Planctomycetaceae bacterium]
MQKIILATTMFFLFSFAAFDIPAQEKYTLRNRYPQGIYEMKTEMDMNMKVKHEDQIIPNHTVQTQYQEIVADAVEPDGSQRVHNEMKRILLKQTINGREIVFDSADEKSKNSPLRMLGVMVGLKTTMNFDKDGKVTEIEGLDEFLEKNSQTFPKQAYELLKKTLNKQALTKTFDILREVMPQQPVAIGEQWKSENFAEIPLIGKVKTTQTNTLKEIQNVDGKELAVIVSQSSIKSDTPQELNMPVAKMTLKSTDIDSENTIQMELKTGLVVSNITQIKMNIAIESTVNNKIIQQNMTGEGKTTMTITRSEK